ncbi:hypothetical protein AVV30_gp025 [Vibrio phage phi 1]|uniref:Uncharacterized protein n=1 Tax=Vibrio phage phi 1 TaxID=1589297 RepID=A0A0B5H8I4_9CAUD|nr:hypothetical protein AVV30_gp025 [Vibrio phage phi 1]AJF40683.1 hypothetical protein SBVP1_0025 [Vibrio phage phi 1]
MKLIKNSGSYKPKLYIVNLPITYKVWFRPQHKDFKIKTTKGN